MARVRARFGLWVSLISMRTCRRKRARSMSAFSMPSPFSARPWVTSVVAVCWRCVFFVLAGDSSAIAKKKKPKQTKQKNHQVSARFFNRSTRIFTQYTPMIFKGLMRSTPIGSASGGSGFSLHPSSASQLGEEKEIIARTRGRDYAYGRGH